MRRILGTGLLVAASLGLAACGTASVPNASTSTTSTLKVSRQSGTTTTTTTTTVPKRRDAPLVTVTGAFRMKLDGGYTASGVVSVGPPKHATPLKLGGAVVGEACTVDSQTDAAIPFQVRITNTTESFSLNDVSSSVFITSRSDTSALSNDVSDGIVNTEYSAGDQEECETWDSDPGPMWGYSLSPNQYTSLSGFIIIPNYYSPAQPAGQVSEISGAYIALMVSDSSGNYATFYPGTNTVTSFDEATVDSGYLYIAVPK